MAEDVTPSRIKGWAGNDLVGSHILIVEDHPHTAEMLTSYFGAQGYEVDTVGWGEKALSFVERAIPDLIVLDIRLPDINGYEVCRSLRDHQRTKHIPILFLTEKKAREDKLKGLDLGAVDYITKPFDIQELKLRVRNVLRRSNRKQALHPITSLPSASLSDERLRELLGSSDWAILSIGLQGINRFSESYGFVARDDVIRSVALILEHIVKEEQAAGAFVGHLDATDFFIIMPPERIEQSRQALKARLSEAMTFFYPYAARQEEDEAALPLNVAMGILRPSTRPLKSLDDLKQALFDIQEVQFGLVDSV